MKKYGLFTSSFLVDSFSSFIHSFIQSFIHSFFLFFIHSYVHVFIHTFIHSFIHMYIYSFIHSFNIFSNINWLSEQPPPIGVVQATMYPWWSLCTLYLSHARWSYRRRLGSLLLCACSMCGVNCSSAITSHCLLICQFNNVNSAS